jgi:hypothetical protein
MKNREPMQQHFAVWGQLDQHFAMILIARPALQSSAFDQPADQLDRTVVAQTELLRDCRHGWTRAGWQALDGEQKLMLLGFDALGTGGFLTEVQELPDTMAELG